MSANAMTRLGTMLMLAIWVLLPGTARGAELVLAGGGQSQAVIVAASDAGAAAQRLQDLFFTSTGARPALLKPSEAAPAGKVEILLYTAASHKEAQERFTEPVREIQSKPEGFLLVTEPARDGRIVIAGADRDGLRYGVGELWNYHLRLSGKEARVNAPLRLVDAPAFSKRILWNWDGYTNWDQDLRRVHETAGIDPNGKRTPSLEPNSFNPMFQQVIDYAADQKLNGLIMFGFLSDGHGGIPASKRLSRHARENSVRILPGIGTMIYGGYYSSGDSPYSIITWMSKHPEIKRMIGKDGKPVETVPCPSESALADWLAEGARWYFKEFQDIGGVNVEHGDFIQCYCERCAAERAKPENDSNFFCDMMRTQAPVMRIGHEINPDLWFIFSPYVGYQREWMSKPPKFLTQYPDFAIVQWTYSGMAADPKNWLADLKPPREAHHSIGLLHQGSFWFGPAQWWGSPGQTYALVADVIQRTAARAILDGSEGFEIVGQIGPTSPQNEMNYLAFGEFTWHPDQTIEGWIAKRLPAIYGGPDLARRFYELTSDNTTDAAKLEAAREEARATAAKLEDPRQAQRWANLTLELSRRHAMAKAGQAKPWGPAPLKGIEDVKIEF